MDTKELQNEFNKLDFEYKQLEERRKKLMEQLMAIDSSLDTTTTIDNGIKIVSWKDGSWEDIGAMIEAHYAGDINITDYWKCEDSRRIKLKNGEFVDLVLIGNNHDDLVTSINGIRKAVFTVQTKNCLETKMSMFNDYHNDPKFSLWGNSDVRNYLNTEFKSLLPDELQSMIKTIRKVTYRYAYRPEFGPYYSESTTTKEAVFLLSEMEVYGTQALGSESDWGRGSDGTQYEYYKTASNRIKCLGIDGISAQDWWLRSSSVYCFGGSGFRRVYRNGYVNGDFANYTYGVVPAFCI